MNGDAMGQDAGAWQQATGRGVRVLVVDSGVEASHPVFAGKSIATFVTRIDERGFRHVVAEAAVDLSGHGTAVAGIISSFAPEAEISSCRVMSEIGGSSLLVIAALHWAIDQGYHVVNCSFTSADAQFLAAYKSVVDRAFCRNVVIVAACNNRNYGAVEYPGSFPTVISTDFGKLDGLTLHRRAGELVEFVGAGEQVKVAYRSGQSRIMTGSSVAAPHVSALVARIRQLRPGWNVCQIKSAMYELAGNATTMG
jgi:subtilisin family serine protease